MIPELVAMQQDERAARRARRRAARRVRLGLGVPGFVVWLVATASCAAILLWGLLTPASAPTWGSTGGIATLRASAVAAAGWAVLLWWRAERRDHAEAAVSSAAFAVVAATAAATSRTVAAVGWLGAMLVVAPLLGSATTFGRWAGRRWRWWSVTATVASLALVLVAVAAGARLPEGAHPLTWAASAAVVAATVRWSWRELRLYRIGRAVASLVAAVSIAAMGLAMVASLIDDRVDGRSAAFATVVVLAVVLGGAAVTSAHRLPPPVVELLGPAVSREPLRTVELAASPVVQRFVARLDQKDPITRTHVTRTAGLAVQVGVALELEPERLRDLAIGALLHDVGKLDVPDEILAKRAPLDAGEIAVIRRHPIDGGEILGMVPSLASAAPLVRAHHERVDGTGYPDRLAGRGVPLEARIIAACDGYDAIANARDHRPGAGHDHAVEILRSHAGTQWDAAVVDALVRVMAATGGPSTDPGRSTVAEDRRARRVALDAPEDRDRALACECGDALPEAVAAELDAAWRLFASDLLREPTDG